MTNNKNLVLLGLLDYALIGILIFLLSLTSCMKEGPFGEDDSQKISEDNTPGISKSHFYMTFKADPEGGRFPKDTLNFHCDFEGASSWLFYKFPKCGGKPEFLFSINKDTVVSLLAKYIPPVNEDTIKSFDVSAYPHFPFVPIDKATQWRLVDSTLIK